jgi:hypothetical protein
MPSRSPGFEFLTTVSIELDADAPLPVGRSPWRIRRVSYIARGGFEGPRLKGQVLQGGGDWSELGQDAAGNALTFVDVRSLWRTHDSALLYVTYNGRLVIPKDVLGEFRDSAKVEELDPAKYYFRISPTFETSDEKYQWLNAMVGVGLGRRTAKGVVYDIFALT